VTEENKKEYVNLVAQHRMTTAIRGQLHAFLSGFWDLVPKARRPCAILQHAALCGLVAVFLPLLLAPHAGARGSRGDAASGSLGACGGPASPAGSTAIR
jgi:hypothetical protein